MFVGVTFLFHSFGLTHITMRAIYCLILRCFWKYLFFVFFFFFFSCFVYFGFSADDAFDVFAIQGSHLVFKHGVQNPVSTHSFQDFEEDSSYSWLLLKIFLFFVQFIKKPTKFSKINPEIKFTHRDRFKCHKSIGGLNCESEAEQIHQCADD